MSDSIYVIETPYDRYDWDEWHFIAEDDARGYFTSFEDAQRAVDKINGASEVREYDNYAAKIAKANEQRAMARKEKAALEAAGLVYRHNVSSFGPSEDQEILDFERWLEELGLHDEDKVRLAEVKPATS